MKTYTTKTTDIQRKWYVIDVAGKTLGRVATEVSKLLIGKHKPVYAPNFDMGDFVIIVNADKIAVTGTKENSKTYFKHTGYFGHWKLPTLGEIREKHPERILEHAVSGMLPKNKMRNRRLKRLKLYTTATHPHSAQTPETIEL